MADLNLNQENDFILPGPGFPVIPEPRFPVIPEPEFPVIPEPELPNPEFPENEFVPNQVVVKFNPEISEDEVRELQEKLGAEVKETIDNLGIQLWSISDDIPVEEAVQFLSEDERVEFSEPNFIVSTQQTFPNDPSFPNEWGLHNTGQTGGTPDADIDAPEAWDCETGSSNVVVGVIDTGIDYTHPDLVNNMWINPGEIPGNGIDDEGNGYVDDVYGWDFVNNDNDPFDDNRHGTHVAGTIAAEGDNGIGVTGVSWDASLMAVKFLNASGGGTTFNAAQAIQYATDNGADLTNNSWGGYFSSTAVETAIAAAETADVLFVAAAGNAASNNNSFPFNPASYTLDNIISVASTDHNDQLSSFSNYGATSVDLGAPGSNIYSTLPNNGYGYLSGTSMAAPHVAGAAALILSQDSSLTYTDVKNQILSTVDSIPALNGITLTGGRLNIGNAVKCQGEISGTKWNDLNGDGVRDANEPGLENWTIYLDQNQNGQLDNGEIFTTTDANGDYTFTNLAAGTYHVAEVLQGGWKQTFPDSNLVLTFDDISTSLNGTIPGGYGGLSWSNDFYYLNGGVIHPGSGYDNGTVSGDYVAFNGFAQGVSLTSNNKFDFNSAYLTAAWNNNLDVTVEGLSSGLLQNTQTVTVDPTSPTQFNFNFSGIDELKFSSSGGTNAGLGGSGEHFALDDLNLNTSGTHTVNLAAGDTVTDIDFGNRQCIGCDDEPNDTIPQAIAGLNGLNGPGTFFDKGFIGDNPNIDPSDDVDLIELQLEAGQQVTIDIDSRDYGSALDSALRLFDSAGNELAFSDDNAAPGESYTRDSYIDFTASATDTYYVGVSSYCDFYYDPFVEGSGKGYTTGEYNIEISILQQNNPNTPAPIDPILTPAGSISNLTDASAIPALPTVATNDLLDISIDGVNQDKEILSYGGANQNKGISSTVNGTELQLEGNGWRKVDITGYEITEDTILNFEFKAQNLGEIQGIGFDNNDVIGNDDTARFFQVAGTQDWGIDNLNQYIQGSSNGFTEYSIPVGDFFRGEFDFLTFGNDHDVANANAMVEFRNIQLIA